MHSSPCSSILPRVSFAPFARGGSMMSYTIQYLQSELAFQSLGTLWQNGPQRTLVGPTTPEKVILGDVADPI